MATKKFDIAKHGKIMDVEEAIRMSGMNYIAQKVPMMSMNGIDAPSHMMVTRPPFAEESQDYPAGMCLGVVGGGYKVVQNYDAMAFMDVFVREHGYHYTQAFVRNGGEVCTIVAESDRKDVIAVGDEVCRQIKVTNGFNGKVGFVVEMSMMRLVCSNGMVTGEAESYIKLKHTNTVSTRMEDAIRVWGASQKFHNEFVERSKQLATVALNQQMVDKFLSDIYGDDKMNDTKKNIIMDLSEHGKGNNGNTLWDLYNGTTEYVDHVHGKSDKRTEYSLSGAGSKRKHKAWKSVNKLAMA